MQGHLFWRLQRAPDTDPYAGSEFDAGLSYLLGKGLRLRGMWAHFIPSGDHYPRASRADYGEAELRYDIPPRW